jgi:hypothetical protein
MSMVSTLLCRIKGVPLHPAKWIGLFSAKEVILQNLAGPNGRNC